MSRTLMKIPFLLMAILFLTAAYVLAAEVPANYTVWDRMPAEAAVNVKLKVQAPVTLYAAPRSSNVSGTISVNEVVDRISCVVYTHPNRHAVKVLKLTKAYKYQNSSSPQFITLYPGTIIHLLQYTGEGTYLGLWNGQLLWWLEGYNISGFTTANANSPWGVYIGEATTADLGIDFWMCLRKSDGTVGWAHPSDYPKGTFNQYWK